VGQKKESKNAGRRFGENVRHAEGPILSQAAPAELRTLGVMAKWPAAGSVKTRLASESSAGSAAELAAAFLDDTLDRLSAVDAVREIVFSPRSAEASFVGLGAHRFALRAQVDGDLGQRMAAFFRAHLPRPTVLVGADSPTLPVAFVLKAFGALKSADVVLGPATDGGVYLIGCRGSLPPMFDEIAWSTPGVLRAMVERLGRSSLGLALLETWYDIDTVEDLRMLAAHLRAMRQANMDPCVPSTERFLATMDLDSAASESR
jgi:rSAM/selenodomain-associated transferase 1